MRILITGGEGQLALEFKKQFRDSEHIILSKSRKELDICNYYEVNKLFENEKFDVVINCAAYTKVDLCETQKDLAFMVNALGARNLAVAADKVGAKVVYISTDYVFDGLSTTPYTEYDLTNPQSIYGTSKLLGEELTRSLSSKYFIVRTAGLYGDGKNFVHTMLDLAKYRDEISIVDDQITTPTYIKDLAEAVIELINTEYYGLYHATNEGQCSWYDFAVEIFKRQNIGIKVVPIKSSEFKSVVHRPAYSVLDNYMFKLHGFKEFRHWKDALYDYLK